MPIGVKTVTTRFSVDRSLITIEQEWFLHPTKGWKRGPKHRKDTPRGQWRRGVVTWETWKDWRR